MWRRGKKQHCGSHFLGRSVTPHGSLRCHTFHKRRGGPFSHINHARSNTIHGNLRRQGLCHHLGQHVQRGLGRTVVGVIGPRAQPSERTHMDNLAPRSEERRVGKELSSRRS